VQLKVLDVICKINIRARYGGTDLQLQLVKRLRQEDHKFEASLGDLVRPCLKINLKRSVSSVIELLLSMCRTQCSIPKKQKHDLKVRREETN
jgi:hypothetical protein